MLIRVLLAAILAGVGAGVFATAAQSLRVTPLILEAETYENAGGSHDHDGTAAASGEAADAGQEAWAPENGWERTLATLGANVVTGAGFALLVTAAILVAGYGISPALGLVWGVAGYVTFVLAPNLGLPPELPGMAAADLQARQIWWLATVLATGAGLAIFALRRQPLWIAAGVALIVAPHLYGAPRPATHESLAPAHLAVDFAVATLVTSFAFWLFLGALLGFLLQRAMKSEAAEAPV
ncbi:MAG: CbtA family protein [Pseudomonadota bacterium]|nr:CbtA family protein [Pseudomonadota bacterium]